MPRVPSIDDKERAEERRARSTTELFRIQLAKLERNIDKPVSIPSAWKEKPPSPPPDFVRNVVGSSAAAGSAEFHIFRNNRKRESERLNYLDRQAKKIELDAEYNDRLAKRKRAEFTKTAKKRIKRLKSKQRVSELKNKKNIGNKNTNENEENSESDDTEEIDFVDELPVNPNIVSSCE